ncbi:cupin domain-containing protein [Cerasicoccus frondis]|uniref:cupin domain-containing protein n=1 Tax=Cerasicoccus frondis TaxID=490090 RepID=UPI0028526D78|nr:cupin domain-containing protein [Cerasicoccus frondis]
MIHIPKHDSGWKVGEGYRKQPLLLPEQLNCEGALVQVVEIPPHAHCPLHHHKKQTEVFYILEGRGEMSIAGQTVQLSPGDLVTTEPGELHSATNPHDKTFRYVVFKTNWDPEDTYW